MMTSRLSSIPVSGHHQQVAGVHRRLYTRMVLRGDGPCAAKRSTGHGASGCPLGCAKTEAQVASGGGGGVHLLKWKKRNGAALLGRRGGEGIVAEEQWRPAGGGGGGAGVNKACRPQRSRVVRLLQFHCHMQEDQTSGPGHSDRMHSTLWSVFGRAK